MENNLRVTRTKKYAESCTNIIWSHVITNKNKLNQILMYIKKSNYIIYTYNCSIFSDQPSQIPKFVIPVLVY